MWCPNCKMEYRKGIYTCADCGAELVEGTEADFYTVDLCEFKVESLADRFVEYLNYSGLEQVEKTEKDGGDVYVVTVLEKQQKKAEKLFRGFLLAMKEEQEAAVIEELQNQIQQEPQEESEEDDVSEEETEYDWDAEEEDAAPEEDHYIQDEEIQKQAENLLLSDEAEEDTGELLYTSTDSYMTKEEEYKDLKFSGITFVIFALMGGVFLTLCQLNLLPLHYEKYVLVVVILVFVVFFVIGVVSMIKSTKVKLEIPIEEAKTEEIYAYLDEALSEDILEQWRDPEAADEENDLLITSHIRASLIKKYSEESVVYLEYIADKYYSDRYMDEDTEESEEDPDETESQEEDESLDTEE